MGGPGSLGFHAAPWIKNQEHRFLRRGTQSIHHPNRPEQKAEYVKKLRDEWV